MYHSPGVRGAAGLRLCRRRRKHAHRLCGISVFCLRAYGVLHTIIPPVIKDGKKLLRQIPYVDRYFDDVTFRTTVSVHLSMMINLLYAGMNGFLGLTEGSAWFVSLAVYYIFLSAIRLMLARHTRKVGFGENMIAEWKRYRLSGILLALMSIALGGMVILVRTKGNSFEYTGNMIYAMTFYTFLYNGSFHSKCDKIPKI